VAAVQKVSVSVLTQVTADQVVITRGAQQASTPGGVNTPAVAHVETSGSALAAPPAVQTDVQNTPAQSQVKESPSSPGEDGAVASAVAPGASTAGSSGGSGSNTPSGGQGSQSNGQGSSGSAPLPTPLVVTLGGSATTIAPTVVPGSKAGSSVTAFVFGPGSTLTVGGSPITVSGNVISAPAAPLPSPLVVTLGGSATTIAPTVIPGSKAGSSVTAFVLGPGTTLTVGGSPITVSGTVISAPAAASTTTGGMGDAIASGLGYTGPLSTGAGSSIGPNLPLWVIVAVAGVFGGLAVGL